MTDLSYTKMGRLMSASPRRLRSEREREGETCIIVVASVSGLLMLFSLALVLCASFRVRRV